MAYQSERAAALISQAIDILARAEGAPENDPELKRITIELSGVMKEKGAAVAMTFDAIYRETRRSCRGRAARPHGGFP